MFQEHTVLQKLLTERIEKLTRTIEIVKAKGKKAEAIGGVAIKDVEIKLKSSYQQLTDLLDERDRLELAIVQKNAETVIEINGQNNISNCFYVLRIRLIPNQI